MKALPYKIYNVVSTFLLGLLVTGTVIASQNQTAISNALGTPNFRVENTGDTNVDSEYFKSKYSVFDWYVFTVLVVLFGYHIHVSFGKTAEISEA